MFYQYFCEANGQIVEVRHSAQVRLKTWGEVCERAGMEPGRTSLDKPVIRLIGGMPFLERLKGLDKDAPSTGPMSL